MVDNQDTGTYSTNEKTRSKRREQFITLLSDVQLTTTTIMIIMYLTVLGL